MTVSSNWLPHPHDNGSRLMPLMVDSPLAFDGPGRHQAPGEDLTYLGGRATWSDEREASLTHTSSTELVNVTQRGVV